MSAEECWQIRIEHILEAISKIERYTAGLSEETFIRQDMTVDAVVRNFQVIGEAARHVPDDVQRRGEGLRSGRSHRGCTESRHDQYSAPTQYGGAAGIQPNSRGLPGIG